MDFRYVGDADEGVDLAAPGGFVHCAKGEWLDLEAELEAINVPARHAQVMAKSLRVSPDWELRDKKQPARKAKEGGE